MLLLRALATAALESFFGLGSGRRPNRHTTKTIAPTAIATAPTPRAMYNVISLDAGLSIVASPVAPPVVAMVAVVVVLVEEVVWMVEVAMRFAHKMQCT